MGSDRESCLGDFDAQKLKDGFAYFDSKDLQNLGTGQAIVRMERAEYDFTLRTMPLPAVDPQSTRLRREILVEKSRLRYASRRTDIERSLAPDESAVESRHPADISSGSVPQISSLDQKSEPPEQRAPKKETTRVMPSVRPSIHVVCVVPCTRWLADFPYPAAHLGIHIRDVLSAHYLEATKKISLDVLHARAEQTLAGGYGPSIPVK